MNVTPESTLGFGHFIAQSDAVGKTLLAVLVLMSVMSWLIIALKGLTLVARQRRSHAFLNFFWNATSLEAVQHEIATHGSHDPFSHLASHAMQAQTHHARYGAAKLEEAGTASDFVTRTIKKVLDEETLRLESGLTLLATVGATAPFVGLFGTTIITPDNVMTLVGNGKVFGDTVQNYSALPVRRVVTRYPSAHRTIWLS